MRLSALFILIFALFVAPPPARAVCVSSPIARLRAGPGLEYRVTWTVGQYMPLQQIGKNKSGSWLQVQDIDGEKHWISREMVSNKIRCVAVKAKVANLRKGPGNKFAISDYPTADRYTPFRQLQRDGEWLQVQDEYRDTFWIADNQVWWPVTRMTLKF
jgi:SH3-like domain-containing protein